MDARIFPVSQGDEAQHGYGKQETDNVAVLDRLDQISGMVASLTTSVDKKEQQILDKTTQHGEDAEDIKRVAARLSAVQAEMEEAVLQGESATPHFQALGQGAAGFQAWLDTARKQSDRAAAAIVLLHKAVATAKTRREALALESKDIEGRRRIFTVDTEVDQILTAYKLTFLKLCGYLLTTYFPGVNMQLDTLIRGILTLPGKRVLTGSTETIRIWRQPRDRELMPLVEAACQKLSDRKMVRSGRRLRFELVDQPPPTAGGGYDAAA